MGLGECLLIANSARDAHTCAHSLRRGWRREAYWSPRPCSWRFAPAPCNRCPRMAPSLGISLERARRNHLHRPPLSPFRVSLNVVQVTLEFFQGTVSRFVQASLFLKCVFRSAGGHRRAFCSLFAWPFAVACFVFIFLTHGVQNA